MFGHFVIIALMMLSGVWTYEDISLTSYLNNVTFMIFCSILDSYTPDRVYFFPHQMLTNYDRSLAVRAEKDCVGISSLYHCVNVKAES